MRDKIFKGLLKIKDTQVNGSLKQRLANNANVSFKGVEGEGIILKLDRQGIAASTGSACSSRSLEPSHVLLAIGLSHLEAHGSLRLTLGKSNTDKDINYLLSILPKIIEELRSMSPFKS